MSVADDSNKADGQPADTDDTVGDAQGGGDATGSGNILAGVQGKEDGSAKDKGEERRQD